MSTGVLIGSSLNIFAAHNYPLIQPTLTTIPSGTFIMGTNPYHQATLSSFQIGMNPVTHIEYQRYLNLLGKRRVAVVGTDPTIGIERVFALGESEKEVMEAVNKAPLGNLLFKSGDLAVVGGFRAYTKSSEAIEEFLKTLKIVTIGDNKLPKRLKHQKKPVTDKNWYEAFAYAYLHRAWLPTEWQWEYMVKMALRVEPLREYVRRYGHLPTRESEHDVNEPTYPGDQNLPVPDIEDFKYPSLEIQRRNVMPDKAFEWTQNWYTEYPKVPVANPLGPISGMFKTLRGRYYRKPNYDLFPVSHTTNRIKANPLLRNYEGKNITFRLATWL